MSEILKEYDKGRKKELLVGTFVKFIKSSCLIAGVILFGIYIGNMLFGKLSLDVMLELQNKRDRLSEDVEYLKAQNAKLQKEFFELKELEPQTIKK